MAGGSGHGTGGSLCCPGGNRCRSLISGPRALRDRRTGRGRTEGRGHARSCARRPPAHPPFRAPPGPRSFAYGPFIHKNPREGGAAPPGCGAPGHRREGAQARAAAASRPGRGSRGARRGRSEAEAAEMGGGSGARPRRAAPGLGGSGSGAGGGTHDVADPRPGRHRFVNRRAAAAAVT